MKDEEDDHSRVPPMQEDDGVTTTTSSSSPAVAIIESGRLLVSFRRSSLNSSEDNTTTSSIEALRGKYMPSRRRPSSSFSTSHNGDDKNESNGEKENDADENDDAENDDDNDARMSVRELHRENIMPSHRDRRGGRQERHRSGEIGGNERHHSQGGSSPRMSWGKGLIGTILSPFGTPVGTRRTKDGMNIHPPPATDDIIKEGGRGITSAIVEGRGLESNDAITNTMDDGPIIPHRPPPMAGIASGKEGGDEDERGGRLEEAEGFVIPGKAEREKGDDGGGGMMSDVILGGVEMEGEGNEGEEDCDERGGDKDEQPCLLSTDSNIIPVTPNFACDHSNRDGAIGGRPPSPSSSSSLTTTDGVHTIERTSAVEASEENFIVCGVDPPHDCQSSSIQVAMEGINASPGEDIVTAIRTGKTINDAPEEGSRLSSVQITDDHVSRLESLRLRNTRRRKSPSDIGPKIVNTFRSRSQTPDDSIRDSVLKDFKAITDRESFVRRMSSVNSNSASYHDSGSCSVDWPSPVSSLSSPPTPTKDAVATSCLASGAVDDPSCIGIRPLPLNRNEQSSSNVQQDEKCSANLLVNSQDAPGGTSGTLGRHVDKSGHAFDSALIQTDASSQSRDTRRSSTQKSLDSNSDARSNDVSSNSKLSAKSGRSFELDSRESTKKNNERSLQLPDISPSGLACDPEDDASKSNPVAIHEPTKLPNQMYELQEEQGKESAFHTRTSFQSRTSSSRLSGDKRARRCSAVSSLASYASPTFNFSNFRRMSMPVESDRRNVNFAAAKRNMSERIICSNGSDSSLSSFDSLGSPIHFTMEKKVRDAKNINVVNEKILESSDDKEQKEGLKPILSKVAVESIRSSISSMSFDELNSANSNERDDQRDFFQSSGLGEGVALLLEHSTHTLSMHFSGDGIDHIDPSATGDGRDDFEYAMKLYQDAIKYGQFDDIDDDMSLGDNADVSLENNENDQLLAARAYIGLGFSRQCRGDLESSLDAYMKVLALWEDGSGLSDHVASVSYTIGTVLIEMQQLYDASDYFSRALRLFKCTQSPGPGNRANILSTEGMLFRVLGVLDRAIDCFRDSIPFYQASSQLNTLKFAVVTFELGSLLSQRGEYRDSANFFNIALEIRKAHVGDSFLVARTHYSLGVTLAAQELNEIDTSLSSASHLEEALRICQQVFTAEHVQSALIVHALGVLNERKGDSLSASAWFAKELTIRKQLFGEDDESLVPLCIDVGTCHYTSGKYELAISFFEEALRIISLVGKSVDAEILYKIASCHDSLCNYDKALEKFQEVKRLHVSHFGVESTPVMQTMLRIGNILLCKGESKKSLDCFNEVLGIGYASDSVKAIEVANALYGRGCAHFCDLHLTDAMKSFNESLNWKLAALGENSPGLACIFYQMAHVFIEQSEYEEAITCFEEYTRLQKLESQRNLHDNAEICYVEGIIAKLKGRQDAALSFFHQALAMFETLFGGDHEKVASIHFDIGCIFSARSNFEEAIPHFQTCLFLRRKLLGSHVDVANTLYEMASVYSRQARTDLAVKCMIESDEIWKTKLRNDEKLTSVLLLSAKLWKSLKCYQPAEENYEQALHQAISIYGQQHEVVASTLLSLGELLQEIDQIQQALFCFDESIQVRTALYGLDSPSVAQVEYTKGVALLFHGDFDEAMICLNRALTIRREKLGPMDATVGDTLNTIGFLQLRMGNIWNDEALDPLTKALEIRRAVGDSSKVVSSLQNIASVYKKRKELDSWIDTHAEILKARQQEFGLDDAKVADACVSLGNNQMSVGRLDEATASFEEALRIRTLSNGYNHKSVAEVLFRIGLLSSRENKFTDAKQLFEEYMRIRAEEEDDPDEEMAQALTLMGDLQKETGEKSKAQINWTSALEIYANLGYPDNHPKVSKLRARQKTVGKVFGLPLLRRPSDVSGKS